MKVAGWCAGGRVADTANTIVPSSAGWRQAAVSVLAPAQANVATKTVHGYGKGDTKMG